MELGTYSSDSIRCPNTMRSVAILACQMGRNASGWHYGGKGHAWNVPVTGNPVPSKGRYSHCAS